MRVLCTLFVIVMVALCNRADHYIFWLNLLITVARDRDSDSERLLYFGRVSFLQSPAIAEDCYILVVLFFYFFYFYFFYFFFRPPNFCRPWADFHETLPHDAVCAEIVYLL